MEARWATRCALAQTSQWLQRWSAPCLSAEFALLHLTCWAKWGPSDVSSTHTMLVQVLAYLRVRQNVIINISWAKWLILLQTKLTDVGTFVTCWRNCWEWHMHNLRSTNVSSSPCTGTLRKCISNRILDSDKITNQSSVQRLRPRLNMSIDQRTTLFIDNCVFDKCGHAVRVVWGLIGDAHEESHTHRLGFEGEPSWMIPALTLVTLIHNGLRTAL